MEKIVTYKNMYFFPGENNVVVEATVELMTKIWGQPKEVRIQGIEDWLTTVSEVVNVPKPNFKIIRGEEGRNMYDITGGGMFENDTNTIVLFRKFSLTTLLHEFWHYVQHKKYVIEHNRILHAETGEVIFEGDVRKALEIDARAWSCSLYYTADPERYNRAVKHRTLHYF